MRIVVSGNEEQPIARVTCQTHAGLPDTGAASTSFVIIGAILCWCKGSNLCGESREDGPCRRIDSNHPSSVVEQVAMSTKPSPYSSIDQRQGSSLQVGASRKVD